MTEINTIEKCRLCLNVLKAKNILPKDTNSFILTNKQKESLEHKSLKWAIKNKFSEDFELVLLCADNLATANKCEELQLKKLLKTKPVVKKGCIGIVCKKDQICNPTTKRCVKKSGKIGQSLIEGKSKKVSKAKVSKISKTVCKKDEILNPATGRCVKKSGPTGQKLLASKKLKEDTLENWLKKHKIVYNKKMTTLDLSDQKISKLPENIAKLTDLQTLDLSNNNIKEVPKSLTKLKMLSFLILTGNPIKQTETLKKLENKGVAIIY